MRARSGPHVVWGRAAVGLVVLLGLVAVLPTAVRHTSAGGAAPPATTSVPVHEIAGAAPDVAVPAADRIDRSWPAGGTTLLAAGGPGRADIGGLTVSRTAQPPAGQTSAGQPSLRVRVADRTTSTAAGVDGVLLSVERADGGTGDGSTALEFGYGSFRHAYGGDYGARLRLVRLPGCALSTPTADGCRARVPVTGQRNDPARSAITVDRLDAGAAGAAAVYALAADGASEAGTYAATSMGPEGTWSAGQQGGEFSFSYPFRVPPVPSGLVPEVALGYSSSTVDGRTSSTNNQPSWVGEGWDYHPGYVERSYRSCRQDGQTTDDLCIFDQDHLSLTLNGRTVRIVKDDTGGGYRAEDHTGLRIERLEGAANGAHDGRHWMVWAPDGTRYFFGSTAESVQTVPVYGDDAGEDCHQSTFAESACQQGYRWNLRQVIDAKGNQIDYHWVETRQKYGAFGGLRTHPYDLTAILDRIEYGTTQGVASRPLARVLFSRDKRCLEEPCTGSAEAHAKWYDTPWDLNCPVEWTSCPNRPTYPTFFGFERLTAVTTQVLRPGTAATYDDVDTWDLGHRFAGTGDGTSMSLQLSGIRHTGKVGGTLALPETQFEITKYANRVANDAQVPFYKYRLTRILSGSGAQTDVTYTNSPWSGAVCTPGTLPSNMDTNDRHCFPVWFNGGFNFFHKYVVSTVTERDLTGTSNPETYAYTYSTEGSSTPQLWKHEFNQLVPDAQQSWSQWAGYSTVVTRHGSAAYGSITKRRYYRGLNGTKTSGTSRNAFIADSVSSGLTLQDTAGFQGRLREEITYGQDGTTDVASTFHTYDRQTVAVKARSWLYGDWNAYRVDEVETATRERVAGGGWRWSGGRTAYDGYGLPVLVTDHGDHVVTDDGTCTYTTYARSDDLYHNMIDFPAQVLTTKFTGSACPAAPVAADVLTGAQTYYDGATTAGAAPVEGLPTNTRVLSRVDGSTPVWAPAGTAHYDAYGRVTVTTDALGKLTRTGYTPATGGLTTAMAVTNPMGHVTTTALRHEWGSPARVTDPNGKVSALGYDEVGRLRTVDLPGGPAIPETEYTYTLRPAGPNTVTTKSLNAAGNQVTSYQIHDGRMRPAQTQVRADDDHPGRRVSNTYYDDRGLAWMTAAFYNAAPPADTYVTAALADIPTQVRRYHDRLGRQTGEEQWSGATMQWRTLIEYPGMDQTVVTPPAGGTRTTTFTDARGRAVRLRQHLTGSAFQDTVYSYDRLGRMTGVSDPAGNTWTTTFDPRGRPVATSDPDRGSATAEFDDNGRLTASTDALGQKFVHAYDDLGRRTGTRIGSATGTRLASWAYDSLRLGLPTSATRYDGTSEYVTAVTGYDDRNRPLGAAVTLPSAAGSGLTGTWTTTNTYHVDGSPATTTFPAVAGMAQETVASTYDSTGHLLTMGSPLGNYVSDVSYHWWGEVYETLYGVASDGKRVKVTRDREPDTRRLRSTSVHTENQTTAGTWDEQFTEGYSYDPAGNVTGIRESRGATTVANQCLRYDPLRQLTDAWTTTTACQATPTAAAVGGTEAYWDSWTYDAIGNRRTETRHAPTGDTTATYGYPGRPHTVGTVTTTGTGAPPAETFGYDLTGNLRTRSATGSSQTLAWTPDGHLATHTVNGQETRYTYDADGNRLTRRDPDGTTTAYLGGFEISRSATGTITATRFYGDVASRHSVTGLTRLGTDHQGTATVAVQDLTVKIRRSTPFGTPRGTVVPWANPKGFVGGTQDSTGLTHLGAREYDPALGRFISVDPVQDLTDPLQWNGYAYAGNNPVTFSDPSGLLYDDRDQPAPSTQQNGKKSPPDLPAPPKTKYTNPFDLAPKLLAGAMKTLKKFVDRQRLRNPCVKACNRDSGEFQNDDVARAAMSLVLELPAIKYQFQFFGDLLDLFRENRAGNRRAFICMGNAVLCGKMFVASELAGRVTDGMAARQGWTKSGKGAGEYNAFHHMYWMALSVEMGVDHDDAILFGVAHEVDNTTPHHQYGSHNSRVDRYNNRRGVEVGVLFRDGKLPQQKTLHDAVLAHLRDADLTGY